MFFCLNQNIQQLSTIFCMKSVINMCIIYFSLVYFKVDVEEKPAKLIQINHYDLEW